MPDHLPLPIVPVLDISQQHVVHAVAGRREEYRAIETPICPGSGPEDLARALIARAGGSNLYVADLDAICGGEPDWPMYAKMLRLGFGIWLDPGIRAPADAERLARFVSDGRSFARVVVGTETLSDRASLGAIVSAIGSNRVALSLDLRDGALVAADRLWADAAPLSVVGEALDFGIRHCIVIDIARVGANAGPPSAELLSSIRRLAPRIDLIAGGGVRGMDDLRLLAEAGCDAALVASWLHR